MGLITLGSVSSRTFIDAGRAFERIWLGVTAHGASLQPMTGFVFLQLRAMLGAYDGLSASQLDLLERLRRDLRAIFSLDSSDVGAILFRIGYGPSPSGRTIRRDISEVFDPTFRETE